MAPSLSRVVFFFCCALGAGAEAAAAGMPPVYINNLAPFAYEDHGVMKGVIYDLVVDIARRAGAGGSVDAVPFKRITARLGDKPNTYGVIWRQPENEASYTWIVKLLDERMMLVAASGSGVDISSVAAARHLRAGVVLGSPADVIAHRLGFDHIEAVGNAESNARKLAAGRIDVWLAVPGVVNYGRQRSGAAMGGVRFGAQIEPVSMYLACTQPCDQADVAKLRAIFDAMTQDGSYARILRQYHY
ncbi:ABC transporter substrate-binding protein [Rugamonas sp.]|uniref:substrate-binding periplasmic protein n=1 Tax=Rugamonas sp. TaxID=1926287 RepID=UPI0025FE5B28|nr:transporter substrate-binding domain-containing protein [Rugamonas sp.]